MHSPKGTMVVFLVASLAVIAPVVRAQEAKQSERDADAFVAWAAKNAIPVTTTEPGKGFKDLQPIKKMIGKARVVALGENLHGVHEFYEVRHRLLEFLVEEMGFTAFAMETGFAEAVKINDYVLGRVDEPERWQHNWFTWGFGNEQELQALVRWMRRYNENPQHTRKLHFYGLDVAVSYSSPLAAIEGALTYLDKVDPDYAALARRQSVLPLVGKFLGSGGGDEARGVSLNKYKKLAVEERNAYTAAIADLVSRFEARRVDYIRRSSEDEYEWAYHYAIAARQLDTAYRGAATEEKPDDANGYVLERDRAMADNVLWVLQREGPSGRIVVWAHNSHIMKVRQWGERARLGLFLDSMLGHDYVNIGFTFYRGVQSSGWEEPYRAPIVEPSKRGSLDGELAQIGLPMFILDLRTVPKAGPVHEWLNQVREMRWQREYQPLNPIQAWDAIFYIHSISPAQEK